LKDEFGFNGLSPAAQAALAGVYESNHHIDARILDVIEQWQKPDSVRQLGALPMTMSLENYQRFWKKAKEDTTCFPCALSFSTMKARASNDRIAQLDWTMTRIPLEVGFAPRCWK
jgi:hypothetical protein